MLPKELRLDPKEIQRISRYGKKFSNDYFDMRVWYEDSLDNSQYAISISTKVDKRATIRNRIKRKVKAAIMDLPKNLKKAKYLIIIKNSDLRDMQNSDITKHLLKYL